MLPPSAMLSVMLSMMLSVFLFGHQLTFGSYVGALIVFGSVGYRTRRGYLAKKASTKG